MSIKMPEEFRECDAMVVEFLDGGTDTMESLSIVLGGLSELMIGASTIIAPYKLGWFGDTGGKAAAAASMTTTNRTSAVSAASEGSNLIEMQILKNTI